jgi:hypothetical protein
VRKLFSASLRRLRRPHRRLCLPIHLIRPPQSRPTRQPQAVLRGTKFGPLTLDPQPRARPDRRGTHSAPPPLSLAGSEASTLARWSWRSRARTQNRMSSTLLICIHTDNAVVRNCLPADPQMSQHIQIVPRLKTGIDLRLPRGPTPCSPSVSPQVRGGSLDWPSEDSLSALPTLSGSPRCLPVSRPASRAHLCPSCRDTAPPTSSTRDCSSTGGWGTC